MLRELFADVGGPVGLVLGACGFLLCVATPCLPILFLAMIVGPR